MAYFDYVCCCSIKEGKKKRKGKSEWYKYSLKHEFILELRIKSDVPVGIDDINF